MFINGKPKVKIPQDSYWNQCPTCGELFESISSFDAHRHGVFGKDRRCMTEQEMLFKGMSKNKYKRWITKAWDNAEETFQ